jgi:hypothetical protein
MNIGKHHRHEHEAYGKHTTGRVSGVSVVELLRRVVGRGEAVRLAWRGVERAGVAHNSDEFPTAVLPVIRDQLPAASSDDEGTEPTVAVQEARQWLRPPGFSWWHQCLARI